MAYFIIGIVGNVLRHVTIKLLKGVDVGLTNTIGCLNPSEFPVLLPQVGLDDLCCPPAIIPFFKNDRRFALRFIRPSDCFIAISPFLLLNS